MINEDQARQIMMLASNYSSYETAAESADQSGYVNQAKKMSDKSAETWLKLKALVDSVTAP